MNIKQKLGTGATIFMAVLMMLSVGVGPAAAQTTGTISTTGTPGDVTVGQNSTTQDLAGNANIELGVADSTDDSMAVVIDVSNLELQGDADLSNAFVTRSGTTVDITDSANGDTVTLVSANFNSDSNEVRLLIDYDTTQNAGSTEDVQITQLDLQGINSSDSSTVSGIQYEIFYDNEGTSFNINNRDDLGSMGSFGIGLVEVENLDTGDTKTVASPSAALTELSAPFAGDNNDAFEIRVSGDAYDVGTLEFNGADYGELTFTTLDDGSETTLRASGSSPVINIQDDDDTAHTISNINIDENDDGSDLIDIDDGIGSGTESTVTVTDSTLTVDNSGPAIDLSDITSSSDVTVTLENNEFADNDGTLTAVDGDAALDGGIELSVQDNNFTDFGTAIDLESAGGSPTVNIGDNTANTFDENGIHIDDNGGTATLNLDAVFENNNFEQSITIEKQDGTGLVDRIVGTNVDAADSAEFDNNAASYVIDFSAGEFTADSNSPITVTDTASRVTITGAGPDASNISATAGGLTQVIDLDSSTNTVGNVEISNLGFNTDSAGSSNVIEATSGSNPIDSLTIDNNRFTVGADNEDVVKLDSGATLTNTEITNNEFEPVDSNNPDYSAIVFGSNNFGAGTTIDVTDNVIRSLGDGGGSNDQVGVGIGAITGGDEVITIADNEFLELANDDGATAPNTDTFAIAQADGSPTTVNSFGSNGELVIDGNVIEGTVSTTGAGGINLALTNEPNVVVTDNAFRQLDGVGGAGQTSVALRLQDGSSGTIENAEISGNTFDSNTEHLDLTGATSAVVTDLASDQTFDTRVLVTTSDSDLLDNLDSEIVHGTVEGGLQIGSGSFVFVSPGTYQEESLTASDGSANDILSTGSAEETIITNTEQGNNILTIDQNIQVDGFTFNSQVDNTGTDVIVNSGSAVLSNASFAGGGDFESRTAIDVQSSDEVRDTSVSGYGTGVTTDAASTISVEVIGTGGSSIGIAATANTPLIADSSVSGAGSGVRISSTGNVEVVRSSLTDNRIGVEITNGGSHSFHYNNILGNDKAGVLDRGDNIAANGLLANWWGSETGPELTDNSSAVSNIIVEDADDVADTDFRPWLTQQFETATSGITDGLFVVSDPTNPGSDTTARLVIASPNVDDTANADTDFADLTEDIQLTTTDTPEDGSLTFASADEGNGIAADPHVALAAVNNNEPAGDYTIRALGTVNSNSPPTVQSYSEPVAGVELSTDSASDELPADDNTELTITAQLVDSDGNAIERPNAPITFNVPNAEQSAAGLTVTENSLGTGIDTDASGQSSISITADTADETIEVTATDNNNNAGFISVDTVEPGQANFTLELVDAPTTITQNESYSATVNVTNEGDAAGTQDITYNLEDSTGISQLSATEEDVQLNASASQEVTFEVAASDTQSLSADDDYAHVFESDDDTLTIENITVEEAGTGSPLDGPAGRFDNNGDGDITVSELGDAGTAFAEGELTVSELGEVGEAFAS